MSTALASSPTAMPLEARGAVLESHKSELQFSVPGIHCAGCIAKIERGLTELAGVQDARVNLSLKRVRVRYDGDQETTDVIARKLAGLGFDAEPLDQNILERGQDATARTLLIRLGVAGFAAMNVMLLSVSVWSGAEGATRDLLHWVAAAITLPTLAFSAQPFFANAWQALKVRRLNMDVPISLAIFLAAATSLYETANGGQHAYFDAALALTFFLLLGRYLDQMTRAKARSAAVELAALDSPKARVRRDGAILTLPTEEVRQGDTVLVWRGARVPVDGRVIRGESEIDNALLTGETAPESVAPGADVFSGTLNLAGPIEIEVTATGEATLLARIAALVQAAEAARTRFTSLAERAAALYAPLVHILAALAFAYWQIATGDTRLAINIATAVLIITCPCALGLAVPAVMTAASGRLYRRGVLLKDGTALERLAEVDTVVLDKTGTLTDDKLTLASYPDEAALGIAAALAQGSSHPLAQAIHRTACDKSRNLPSVSRLTEHPGFGIEGWIGKKRARLGQAAWLGAEPSHDAVQSWLSIDGQEPRAFTFRDRPKPGAAALVAGLKARGLNPILLSGDTQAIAERIANELGIQTAIGGMTPDRKHQFITAEPGRTLMVGDGLNDTAALAAAHVSAAPGKAIDAARTAADIILIGEDLTSLLGALDLAKTARRRILENFAIAAGYNLIAVPLALTGLATPLLAALAMSSSSISVTLNALRLGGKR